MRCGCRLDCGGKGIDPKTMTKIGVVSKKKKKKKKVNTWLEWKNIPLLGLKLAEIVELTGDDLFFFYLEITSIFVSYLHHYLDNQACNRISPSRF